MKRGHGHEWDNCPDNLKKKREREQKHQSRETQHQENWGKSNKGFFDETSNENVSSSDEESLWSNDLYDNYSTSLADNKTASEISDKVLLSVVVQLCTE